MTDRARIESVFEEALGVEPDRRLDFVAAACGADAAMRSAVLRLLSAHEREAGVLETPPQVLLGEPDMPERVGPYRLLRQIGRGGMGVVYDAERDDGQFRRRAAVKILRHGSDPELMQRLLAERQILATLDHPNIARLLDGGMTADGRPFLVMEYVDGLPIDIYCERMRLSVAERLRLFAIVARAVEFAHRSLVVHRDLKPSNILVTPDGRPKLLDFGIAKVLQPWAADTPITREQRALTLEYASPEQLRGESLTTTTDVYSLGVVLYELLTGRRPHEQHETSLADHAAAVCGAAIERPSSRVLKVERLRAADGTERVLEPTAIAHARQTTAQRLSRQLRGDVDAIVDMALRPEPLRRYGAAGLLAQDIEHHLQYRPLEAHRGGRSYALGRLLRRHRIEAAAVLLAIAALLASTTTAFRQRSAAELERERAEAARAQSEEIAEFLLDLFRAGDPNVAGTTQVTARDLVRRGAARVDELTGQPLLQARLLGTLAAVHEQLGEYDDAQRMTQRALDIRTAAGAFEDGVTGDLLLQLGVLQRRRGEYDSAQATFMRARDLQERVLGPDHPSVARTIEQLAGIAIYRGDHVEAERRARDAFELYRRTLGETHRLTVNSLVYLATVLRTRGAFEESERLFRHAIELRPQATGSTLLETRSDRLQLGTLLLRNPRRHDEAAAIFRTMLAGTGPERPEDVGVIIWASESLAEIATERGDHARAEELMRDVLELRRATLGESHPMFGGALHQLAEPIMQQGRLDEAEQLLTRARDIYVAGLGEHHLATAGVLISFADLHVLRGNYGAADSLLQAALAIRAERSTPRSLGYGEALRMRAAVRLRMGDAAGAERLLVEALDIVVEQASADSPEARGIHALMAEAYTALGRHEEARLHRARADAR